MTSVTAWQKEVWWHWVCRKFVLFKSATVTNLTEARIIPRLSPKMASGCAAAQAVSSWCHPVSTRTWSEPNPYSVCGWQGSSGRGFFVANTSVYPCRYHSHSAPYSHFAHPPQTLYSTVLAVVCIINLLATDFFFQILAHPVFKIWVIQKPNKVALWNKRHFEGGKMEIIQHV